MTGSPRLGRRVFLLAVLCLPGCLGHADEEYVQFVSPDRAYRVVVRRKVGFLGVMPGQAGDSPGVIRLEDSHGALIREADIEMVQLVRKIEWNARTVSIQNVGVWKLPE